MSQTVMILSLNGKKRGRREKKMKEKDRQTERESKDGGSEN